MALSRYRFRIPLKVRFSGVGFRTGYLYKGPGGWGEASPFPGFAQDADGRCHASARELATDGWPHPRISSVRVSGVVGATEPEKAHYLAARSGCTAMKVKVGDVFDEARVEAVRDAIGPEGELRIDANGAWDVDTAIAKIAAFQRFGVCLVEQPVKTIEDLAKVRAKVQVPIAADECIASVEDAREVARIGAADVIVVKLQYAGGPSEALRIIDASGLPAVVSSPVETSVGIAAGAAFAASLDQPPFAHGLGTGTLLAFDVVTERLIPQGGMLQVRVP